jgi:hypothetical protein
MRDPLTGFVRNPLDKSADRRITPKHRHPVLVRLPVA